MSNSPSPLLQANLDRVLDGVLRTLRSGTRDAEPAVEPEAEQARSIQQDNTSSEILTTLCGRVAEALRGMEVAPGSKYDYRAIGTDPDHHAKLDVRR